MKKVYIYVLGFILILMAGCGPQENATGNGNNERTDDLTPISFSLDWTPNTNHTGIYVAKDKGFFEEEGLDVEIMLPGEIGTDQLVATGEAELGIGVQEHVTIARDENLPIVSVAAIMQHNTAGYASPVEKAITEPKDFEGKTFGAVGNDLERAMMQTIMEENGVDYGSVDFKNIGDADYFTAVERDIDFSLVYQGWTGVEAALRDQELNMVYLKDFSEALDFYTPLITTSEKMIKEEPDTVESFVHATVKGYEYAIDNPEEAAEVLIDNEPDVDAELIKQSQAWLSEKYQDDADQFGIQEKERWELTKDFMLEHEIITEDLDMEEAFTNEFLPRE